MQAIYDDGTVRVSNYCKCGWQYKGKTDSKGCKKHPDVLVQVKLHGFYLRAFDLVRAFLKAFCPSHPELPALEKEKPQFDITIRAASEFKKEYK